MGIFLENIARKQRKIRLENTKLQLRDDIFAHYPNISRVHNPDKFSKAHTERGLFFGKISLQSSWMLALDNVGTLR